MCGRYRLSRRKQIVEEYFDAFGDGDWNPRYNIAPTLIPVIRQHQKGPEARTVSDAVEVFFQIAVWSLHAALGKKRAGAGPALRMDQTNLAF